MTTRRSWPDRPPVEEEDALPGHLDRIGADALTRAFCLDLARDGVARIDLGEEGRALCDRAAADIERRFARGGIARVQDAWLRSRAVRALATSPTVLRLLEAAYARPAFAFQTLNFRSGTQQAAHADSIHFHSRPERFMCGVWVALEDIAEGAGPLAYRPGSHRLPVLTMRGAGVNHPRPTPGDYAAVYVAALADRLDAAGFPRRTALLKRGEALVWAANLAHGGAPVTDPAATRRSLVTHYFFADCLYYTPMTSDMEDGRFDARLAVDVRTGGVRWPRDRGRPVPVSRAQLVNVLLKLLLRRPHAS